MKNSVTAFIGILLFAFSVNGCEFKNSTFFGPYDDDFYEEEDGPPLLGTLRGDYNLQYNLEEDTCDSGSMSHSTDIDVEINESMGRMSIFFPDSPGFGVHGPYNSMTGNFTGASGRVDIGDGYEAEEEWDVDFYYGMNLPSEYDSELKPFGGISMVNIYDPSNDPYCEVSYNIFGYKVAF